MAAGIGLTHKVNSSPVAAQGTLNIVWDRADACTLPAELFRPMQ